MIESMNTFKARIKDTILGLRLMFSFIYHTSVLLFLSQHLLLSLYINCKNPMLLHFYLNVAIDNLVVIHFLAALFICAFYGSRINM